MKFLAATALLLASLASTVSAEDVTEVLKHYEGKTKSEINDAMIIRTPEGNFMARRRQNGLMRLVPRGKDEERKLQAQRKEVNEKINQNRRKLDEVEIIEPVGKDLYFSREFTFKVQGLGGAADPTLVFSCGADSFRFPIEDSDILLGVATLDIGGFPEGSTCSWSVETGGVSVAEGDSFGYGPPAEEVIIVRNSGTTTVEEAAYEGGGQVQGAVGRIYFSSYGVDYACTGTVIKDNKSGRSLVLTAAHCVWDDIDENFGSNVIFIPNRDAVTVGEGETAADIHRFCEADICGCWSLSGGVVHDKWRDVPWPSRLDWDIGFWVVDDIGSHAGQSCGSDALDVAVTPMEFAVGVPIEGEFVHNFGYSLEYNPDFRYCAESVGTEQPTAGLDTAWMDNCGLTGGSSGGPWISNFDSSTGVGTVVSVNSWSYSASAGMGAPLIDESESRCLVNAAREVDIAELEAQEEGFQGIYVNCYDRPCIPDESTGRKLRGNRVLCEHNE